MDKILSPIKGRVLQYVDYKGITKKSFYETTGISSSNFKGLGAKSELGGDKIITILTIYDEINPIWLLLGEGNMLKDKSVTQPSIDNEVSKSIEDILTDKIMLRLEPILSNIDYDLRFLVKNVGELRLDLDDLKEEIQEKKE